MLAFNDTGTTVARSSLPTAAATVFDGATPVQVQAARIGDLPAQAVPNTLTVSTDRDYGKALSVRAVDVTAALAAGAVDYYAFTGHPGDVMSFEVISNIDTLNASPVDPILALFGGSGRLTAENAHEFESGDSTLIDVTIPADGTYELGVRGASAGQAGAYQLFAYGVGTGAGLNVALANTAGGDTLVGGSGNDTFLGSSGVGTFSFAAGSAGTASFSLGSGQDVLDLRNSPLETYTADRSFASVIQPVVNTVTPATALATSAASTTYGRSVTFSATVTAGASPEAAGTVTFLDGTTVLATAVPLDAGGRASFTTSSLKVTTSPHDIKAVHSGSPGVPVSSDSVVETITPATLTVTLVVPSKVYDATTAATITGRTLVGVFSGVVLSYVGGTATFSDKNVGNGKTVTTAGLGLTGVDSGNYTVNTTATTTASITPAVLTVTAAGQNKVYDGTTAATVTLSDNRIAGDVLTASYATAAFTDPNAGTGKTINVGGITISGPDAGNYTVNATATTTAVITKANQTIVWAAPAAIGYGTPLGTKQLDATVSGVPGGSAPGALTYSPPSGTILLAGMNQSLTVSAAATSNYNAATLTVSINVLTASQQTAVLTQDVAALVNSGTLTAGQGNALTHKLALKGKHGDTGKVNAFLNQVNAFLKTDILTKPQADTLIAGADMLLVTLSLG